MSFLDNAPDSLKDLTRDLDHASGMSDNILPWDIKAKMQITANGTLRDNLYNVEIAVRGIRCIYEAIYWDEFRARVTVSGPLPWDLSKEERTWSDHDTNKLTSLLNQLGLQVKPPVVHTAVDTVARENARHPICDWLRSRQWDRTPRLDTWLSDYMAVSPSAYTSAIGPAWLISAVARVANPGCQVDTMIILQGRQGAGKSSAVRILFGSENFTDQLPDLTSKDAALQLHGAWAVEISELDQMRKAEATAVKAFITRRVDRYRPPFGRCTVDMRRQCIFVGTTNDDSYLRDPTGARRFWPVTVGDIDLERLKADRDQLWAEAYFRYQASEPWWITDPDILEEVGEQQELRKETDEWDSAIDRWMYNNGYPQTDLSVGEILSDALGITRDKWSRRDQMRVSKYLKSRNFDRYQKYIGGTLREWRYRPRSCFGL